MAPKPLPGKKGAVQKGQWIGELRLHRDGYGFVVSARAGEPDAFVPARFIGDAMHTDVVEVRVMPGREGKLEGRITRVVEHRVKGLMGRIERYGDAFQVVADDRRVRHRIFVKTDKIYGAKHGDNVIVNIVGYPSGDTPMVGEVAKVLGKRGEEPTEKAAVIARHQLKREFPSAAERDADAVAKFMDERGYEGRVDLRKIPFVTIDGETAKDFDDAVAVEKLDNGNIRLWVSIADVSFFVRPQTALDSAAYERGTSVYFPGDCIPMLPEQISNGLCSLRPKEDRFTMTAEMDIDKQGKIARRKFYRSVINSKERMTYTQVKQILVEKDAAVCERYRDLVPRFELMEECHKRLRAERVRRGSIDFDLPEPEIVIDMQGSVADIIRADRHIGHMMIEDLMIAANESVAEFLTQKNAGCVYRVHEPPPAEKLTAFAVLMNNLGYKFRVSGEPGPGALARVVGMVRGKPEERLVNHMMLRSMSQAVYSPENGGHYGLASKCYCHFTSPIRRYPDLVVHRLLTNAIGGGSQRTGSGAKVSNLGEISEHCSRRERIAMDAEREMAKLFAAFFTQGKIGEEFDGIISHVTKFGFFVELIDFFIEGLVHIDAIDDDKYFFEEKGMSLRGRKKKRVFKMGDKVRIEVTEVNIPDREILFALV